MRCGYAGTIVLFVLLPAMLLANGCGNRFVRRPLRLESACITADHAPVVIDGVLTTPGEWDGAATVPITSDAIACFLWDDQGIYMRLSGKRSPPAHLIVYFDTKEERVDLQFSGGWWEPGMGRALHLISAVHSIQPYVGALLGPTLYRYAVARFSWNWAGVPILYMDGNFPMPWDTEAFLLWRALKDREGPPELVYVGAYELVADLGPHSSLALGK